MERKNDTTVITTRLPTSLKKQLDKEVETSRYMSKSDFVRQAVREKIRKEGGGASESE